MTTTLQPRTSRRITRRQFVSASGYGALFGVVAFLSPWINVFRDLSANGVPPAGSTESWLLIETAATGLGVMLACAGLCLFACWMLWPKRS